MAAHRFYRLYITQNWGAAGDNGQIVSMELRTTAGGTNLATTGSGTSDASSSGGGGGTYAFDSDPGTQWGTGAGLPQWLSWDFGVGVSHDIGEVTLVNSSLGSWSNGFVRNAEIQYSDDGISWSTWGFVTERPQTVSLSVAYTPLIVIAGDAELSAPMSSSSAFGGGAAAFAPPAPMVAGASGGQVSISPPRARVISIGGSYAVLASGPPSVHVTGHNSFGERAAFLNAPSPILAAASGGVTNILGPRITASAAGTVAGLGDVAIRAPMPSIHTAGTVSAMAGAVCTVPMPVLVGYSGAVCSITLSEGSRIQSSANAGGIAAVRLTCPLFTLAASGTMQNYGGAELIAPAAQLGGQALAWVVIPSARLVAIGHAEIAVDYEAYALNLNHAPRYESGQPAKPMDEMTRYANFPFTHVVRYQNSYFGANSTGLYLLEGTTDDGAPIEWDVQTAISDFGTPQLKTLEMAFFGGRLGPAAEITLFVGETATNPYTYTTPRDTTAKNYRQAFGRGLKSRYYSLAMKGTDELVLDSMTLNIANLARRI